MSVHTDLSRNRVTEAPSAGLMWFMVATLVVMSTLHLAGVLDVGSQSSNGDSAGIAEAVIAVVLAYGAAGLRRRTPHARRDARLATGFAIVGFLIGLSFTVPSGDAVDIVYHGFGLVVLLITLGALRRSSERTGYRR
ncbi:MAG: hypothetical protein WAK93_06555 [Solirubrobacteraceae bacterium]